MFLPPPGPLPPFCRPIVGPPHRDGDGPDSQLVRQPAVSCGGVSMDNRSLLQAPRADLAAALVDDPVGRGPSAVHGVVGQYLFDVSGFLLLHCHYCLHICKINEHLKH